MDAVEGTQSVAYPLDLIMPGAAPSLKRFACHPHAVQHQDSATATREVRAMTPRPPPAQANHPRRGGAVLMLHFMRVADESLERRRGSRHD